MSLSPFWLVSSVCAVARIKARVTVYRIAIRTELSNLYSGGIFRVAAWGGGGYPNITCLKLNITCLKREVFFVFVGVWCHPLTSI